MNLALKTLNRIVAQQRFFHFKNCNLQLDQLDMHVHRSLCDLLSYIVILKVSQVIIGKYIASRVLKVSMQILLPCGSHVEKLILQMKSFAFHNNIQ